MKTYITTKDLTITSLYEEYITDYTIFMIETVHDDICFAYEDNKTNLSNHQFNRTILVVDRGADFDFIYKTINENIKNIHTYGNTIENIAHLFGDCYIHLLAQTSAYWSDVRYSVHDRSGYLADEVFEYDTLRLKVMELVKNKFFDRDILADICLEKNLSDSIINKATNILKKQEIDFKLIESLLARNDEINNFYQKTVLTTRV